MRRLALIMVAPLALTASLALADTAKTSGSSQTTLQQGQQVGARQASAEHKLLLPDQMSWQPAPAGLPPGALLSVLEGNPERSEGRFVARLKAPAGYHVAPHSHPTDESLTILSGSMLYAMGDQADKSKATTLPAGTHVFVPGSEIHTVWAGDEGFVLEIQAAGPFGITYVNPADDPRRELAKTPQ